LVQVLPRKQVVHLYPPSGQILFLDQSLLLVAVLETTIAITTYRGVMAQLAVLVVALPAERIQKALEQLIRDTMVAHLLQLTPLVVAVALGLLAVAQMRVRILVVMVV
jgi:hypothetical protein